MEQKRNETSSDTDVKKANGNEQGRVPQPEQAPGNSNDISQVDRQEGQMDNGELGGNFNKPDANNA